MTSDVQKQNIAGELQNSSDNRKLYLLQPT